MTELLTAAQMRAIEQAAIASGEVTGLELMERAGRGVVEAIFEEWPELKATSHRAVVLCGPGNNGGDGFVVARLLKEWGWEVEVFLYGDPERLPPDARVNYERWLGMGEVHSLTSSRRLGDCGAVAHLIVDAVFGTGLTRPLGQDLREAFIDVFSGEEYLLELEGMDRRAVSIDVPSGVCADSGRVLGHKFWADLTVTFHRPKVGHLLFALDVPRDEGFRVVPIGLSEKFVLQDSMVERLAADDTSIDGSQEFFQHHPRLRVSEVVTLAAPTRLSLSKGRKSHKYSHGHALILSGPSSRGGAGRLAARGALRIGAGVVTVGCPRDAIPENAARLDAVMLRGVADGLALEEALADPRINALCVGPGLGLDAREAGLLGVALGRVGFHPTVGAEGGVEPHPTKRRIVLDADALTILSQTPDLFAALHEGCVLTPHAGEFARLFPDIAEKLAAPATKGPAYSKVDATREAAKRAGCVVLYKGPDTVIADPSGRCAINSAHYDRAAPWLATAGSGDVLAGFITGLLARGFSPFDAACTGAWLHVECALSFGPGLIAEDLPEELPKVFRALGM